MRLREPLYGIRVASMHFVAHLSLLINMLRIDCELWNSEGYKKWVKEWNAVTHYQVDKQEVE